MKKNKQMFLVELERKIPKGAPIEEKDTFLAYCSEMIQDLIEDGYSEEEAIFKLGNPDSLIYDNFESWFVVKEQQVPRKTMPFLIIIAILGFPLWGSLLLAAILVILSGYIVLWCGPFITGSFAFAGVIGGVVASVTSLIALQDGAFIGITQFGVGITLFGLGLIFTIVTYKISSIFLRGTSIFTKRIIKILFGWRYKFV